MYYLLTKSLGYSCAIIIAALLLLCSLAINGCVARSQPPTIAENELAELSLSEGPVEIPGIQANASGIAFNSETNRLFVISNGPEEIVELTMSGEFVRKIELIGFQDTEDIVHVGGDRYVIIEERRNAASVIRLGDNVETINRKNVSPVVITPENSENKGLEGVAYDPDSSMLYFVKEKRPRKLITAQLSSDDKITENFSRRLWPWEWWGVKDISASAISTTSGRLVMLSDESKRLTTVSGGKLSGKGLDLTAGSSGLTEDIEQAEGVVMDDKGIIYICSEPNLLYVFKQG